MLGSKTLNHLFALAFSLVCVSAGVVLGLQGWSASDPWLGPLLGFPGGLADTVAGGLLFVGGSAFAWKYRKVASQPLEQRVNLDAVIRRVQELD